MAQISTNELKVGMKIEINNEPYIVIINDFVKPGKGQAFNRIKLKNIVTGRVIEKTYKSGDKLNLADVEEKKMRLLYTERENAIFMDETTYEQVNISFSVIKENKKWLLDDTVYETILYKGQIIDIIPPTFMEFTIIQTDPGIRGDTASGRVLKPATISTGAIIQVPIFVEQGERIKVDTRTGEYVSRV